MIMSHGLKVIFVKTKKVGGTSFEIALSKYCNDDDIVCKISEKDELIRSELGFQGPVNFRERSREKYRDPRYGKDHPIDTAKFKVLLNNPDADVVKDRKDLYKLGKAKDARTVLDSYVEKLGDVGH